MSTEVVPEGVLRTFIKIYPDLFPQQNLAYLGLIPDPEFGWPIGFSKKNVSHLGDLPSVGLNCAACHVAEVRSSRAAPLRVLGATSHFDAEAFFGAIAVATFRTSEPENMKLFLGAYFDDPAFAGAWMRSRHISPRKWRAIRSGQTGWPRANCRRSPRPIFSRVKTRRSFLS
jgi:hypothetical protein